MAVDLHRALLAFTGSENPVAYYARFWDRTNTIRQAIYVSNKCVNHCIIRLLQSLMKTLWQLDSGLPRGKIAEQRLRFADILEYGSIVIFNQD
ncbi:hypothetical protein V5O48_007728 [Marasmius crinis-equi]|uniref:Uncharacterized protein n=1 Tax=Marasmius crinis-equi TaxID=585013 RepID=A0ABR3FG34_9AGAR